jgi:hypothetical protein
MQRAKLFGALFAYVNNIQITWKTMHLSVFCRTDSPSTDQSRAEGNNTECVGKKTFNGSNQVEVEVLPTGFGPIMQCVTVIIQLVSRDHVCRFENGSQMAE